MDSGTILRIHTVSVMLFLLIYIIKTILLFSNKKALTGFSKVIKIPEMIISITFLASGIWLYTIIGGLKKYHIIKLVMVAISIPLAVIGFKKFKKGLALFSLLLIIGAYGLAEMSRNKIFLPAKVNISEATASPGEIIYMQNCVFCHGTDGKKMYRDGPDLTLSTFGTDAIKQMINEGSKGKMPSYKLVISDENINNLAEYVNGLKVNATPIDTTGM